MTRDPGSTDIAGAAHYARSADVGWHDHDAPSAAELAQDEAELRERMQETYAENRRAAAAERQGGDVA